MAEYNKLTQVLLAQGYSLDNHPAWVRPGSGRYSEGDALDNIQGGFEYNWKEMPNAVFKTPCGLHVQHRNTAGSMSWQGIEWTYENDLARVYCPFNKRDCPLIHPLMQEFAKNKYPGAYCNVTLTKEPYNAVNSIEHFEKIADKWKKELFDEFVAEHQGRYCENHMRYDYEAEEWSMDKYNPDICRKAHCSSGKCTYLGVPFTRKKGNVFYDLRITYSCAADDDSLFQGTLYTAITKGIKAFSRPTDMLICTNYAKMCRHELERKVLLEYHFQKFMTEASGHVYQLSVENIRAEKKETRDLRQDLADIRNGIRVVHEADALASAKEQKHNEKEIRREKEKARYRRKLMKGTPLKREEESRVKKLFSAEELSQIKPEQKPPEPVQMTLFDLM